jgi:hypothetical protein
MTIDIITDASPEPGDDARRLPAGLRLRDAVQQLRASGRLESVELKPVAVPVTRCGVCGQAIGRMFPSEIDCPRRRRP